MDSDTLATIRYDEEPIDIEVIMRQIREQLARQHGTQPTAPRDMPGIAFDATLYDELYAANQTFDQLYVAPYLTPSRIPLIGGLWQRVRLALHGLVVFYANRLAEAQMRFNAHAIRVLNEIVRSVDSAEMPDKVARLERTVQELEQRLATPGTRGTLTMRIHMMTPVLTTGDAIGNYMISLQRVFGQLGVSVRLYADHIDPAFRHQARPTAAYRPTGQDILWFHYSIWADNFAVLRQSTDFKVLDYHGVTPPHLSAEFDPRLAALCEKGIAALPAHANVFDWCIYHADNGRLDLEQAGYTRFSKVRLPVDTAFFGLKEDETLAALLRKLEYILFVGRIVPQKDVLGIIRVFAEVQKHKPDAALFLVGGHDVLPGYVEQARNEIQRLGVAGRVQMTGKISDRAALTTMYRHAKFLISLSEWENCCVPSGEAMFFGLPVINARRGAHAGKCRRCGCND